MYHPKHAETISVFDSLPSIARVPIQVVCGVTGRSRASVWRDVIAGRLPQPVKLGASTRWVVGELRAALTKEAT
jgi:predicted DNA-binding transcriptional regulator AlpA